MDMPLFRFIAPVILGRFCTAPATHADVMCSGLTSDLLTEKNRSVIFYTTFRDDRLMVCRLRGLWDGVLPEICRGWLATLTTLRGTQERATGRPSFS